jgi:hypothetical protein
MNRRYIVAIALLVAFASAEGADRVYQFRLPEYNEPIYGTWVNDTYSGETYLWAQKWTFLNWGRGMEYARVSDREPLYEWNFVLVEKRTDTEGRTWYKVFFQWPGAKDYNLIRISRDLSVMECIEGAGFPEESQLAPGDPLYRVMSRQ